MRKIYKRTLLLSSIFLVILIAAVITIDYKFSHIQSKIMYSSCYKVWAHRGFFKENQPNSIESFEKAFDLGAVGTELDIFYDLETARFIVSHDYPYNKKNGRILTLEEVFLSNGGAGKRYYWLDFKT